MKALIIENEYEVDTSIQAFLKDNPTLFESVDEQLFCQMRGAEELAPYIVKADAIVIATTWMYKEQVEEFIDAFLDGPLKNKPMKFFIHWCSLKFNEWRFGWMDEKELRAKIVKLMKRDGIIVYEYFEDDKAEHNIEDELNIMRQVWKRAKYVHFPLRYSDDENLFYNDHPYYTLEEQLDDFKDEIKLEHLKSETDD